MVPKILLLLALLFFCGAAGTHDHKSKNASHLAGIEFPEHPSFNAVTSSAAAGCNLPNSKKSDPAGDEGFDNRDEDENEDEEEEEEEGGGGGGGDVKQTVKLNLKRWWARREKEKESVVESKMRDLARIQTLYRRMTENKNQNTVSRVKKEKSKAQVVPPAAAPESSGSLLSGQLVATLESGVSLGSGEYFMDVFVGTPPKHFSLILDTGSDLNWIQCEPCYDCFEQNGPHYDPSQSSSYRNISCHDPRCHYVSSPDPPQPCKAESQTCPYYYWYGDSSNTTGDFALETFTVNLTMPSGKSEFRRVENVMFGCGHWNRGLFHGAAGLLGLGRGPLSFASQLQSLYGHSFSYCLVDRNSDANVSSKLIFGEDKGLLSHPELNFTTLVAGKENPVDTFYYVKVRSLVVGGEAVHIPENFWEFAADGGGGGGGGGGTIIDSGTTLSYFAEPAYQLIKEAFMAKVKGLSLVKDFPVLDPCYNVTGVDQPDLPDFGIVFSDGAVWNFPVENYFIEVEPREVVCLAILGTPRSALSIIGNYQQQNFHILYDTKESKLGFAPTKCSEV